MKQLKDKALCAKLKFWERRVFCMIRHFVRYFLHSKAHALPNDVSTWAVLVLRFLSVDSVTFLSPIDIWNLNNLFQATFMLWSMHLVQPSESFAITQASRLCVEKVIFPLPSRPPFPPLDSPFWCVFPFSHSKRKISQGIPCVERVYSESEAHLAI